MRPAPWLLAEPFRLPNQGDYGDDSGAFSIPHPSTGTTLLCVASSGNLGRDHLGPDYAWDHVSVSTRNRCPNWAEMNAIKAIFWGDDETVMQLHVPARDHLNLHPYCLHLWRPLLVKIPRPPADTVAPGNYEANREYQRKPR